MKPDILVLDEPTAGLDPQGRDEILGLVKDLHDEQGITVILVSHSMEDVADYVNRILVVNDGKIMMDGEPHDVFAYKEDLEKMGLAAPNVSYIMQDLKDTGFKVGTNVTTVAEARVEILRSFRENA